MRILNRHDIAEALNGRENTVLSAVQAAYVRHARGESQVPFSTFLRPDEPAGSRIIALPAYLGGDDPMIGIKWISSFPANVARGYQRASAVSILNDLTTGYPLAVLESSQISAARTAAGAALASHLLHDTSPVHTVGLIGCGTINRAVFRYLRLTHPEIRSAVLHDAVPDHAVIAAESLAAEHPDVAFTAGGLEEALQARTVSIATTDSSYWLDLTRYPKPPTERVILHLSLRDLSPSSVLGTYNIVDDVEHALQAGTSLQRAAEQTGHRAFIHAALGDLIGNGLPRNLPGTSTAVFSPFGLGILDLAVSTELLRFAEREGLGTVVDGFDPGPHSVTGDLNVGVS